MLFRMRAVNRKDPTERESAENALDLYKTAAAELSLHEGPESFQTVDDIGKDVQHASSTDDHVSLEDEQEGPQPVVHTSGSQMTDGKRYATNTITDEYPEGIQAIIGD